MKPTRFAPGVLKISVLSDFSIYEIDEKKVDDPPILSAFILAIPLGHSSSFVFRLAEAGALHGPT